MQKGWILEADGLKNRSLEAGATDFGSSYAHTRQEETLQRTLKRKRCLRNFTSQNIL